MQADTLTPTLSALSDPTRRAIVARLARGEATVTELTAPLAISMPAPRNGWCASSTNSRRC